MIRCEMYNQRNGVVTLVNRTLQELSNEYESTFFINALMQWKGIMMTDVQVLKVNLGKWFKWL